MDPLWQKFSSSIFFNIYHTSFGNVASFYGDGNVKMHGFTQLGDVSPKIKIRKYTGTIPNGNQHEVILDEDILKIIDYEVLILVDRAVGLTLFKYKIKPSIQNPTGYDYKAFLRYNTYNFTPIASILFDSNSNNLEGGEYSILITY